MTQDIQVSNVRSGTQPASCTPAAPVTEGRLSAACMHHDLRSPSLSAAALCVRQEKPKLPFIPGSEVSGVVSELGGPACLSVFCLSIFDTVAVLQQ